MDIKVRPKTGGSEAVITVFQHTKVEELRRLIQKKFSVLPEQQSLFFQDKQLADGHTMIDYTIKVNDVIQLMVRQELVEAGNTVGSSSSSKCVATRNSPGRLQSEGADSAPGGALERAQPMSWEGELSSDGREKPLSLAHRQQQQQQHQQQQQQQQQVTLETLQQQLQTQQATLETLQSMMQRLLQPQSQLPHPTLDSPIPATRGSDSGCEVLPGPSIPKKSPLLPGSGSPSGVVGQAVKRQCLICGDRTHGCNYGVLSCEPCKTFFRSSAKKNKKYICVKGGSCTVDITTRKRCSACRLKKCLDKGMRHEDLTEDHTYQRGAPLPPSMQGGSAPSPSSSCSDRPQAANANIKETQGQLNILSSQMRRPAEFAADNTASARHRREEERASREKFEPSLTKKD